MIDNSLRTEFSVDAFSSFDFIEVNKWPAIKDVTTAWLVTLVASPWRSESILDAKVT
jgi:hypothetical protein